MDSSKDAAEVVPGSDPGTTTVATVIYLGVNASAII